MKELQQLRQFLLGAIKEAHRVQQNKGGAWGAGYNQGLEDALELLDRVVQKSVRLPGDAPPSTVPLKGVKLNERT
jgi:hypothetical protein